MKAYKKLTDSMLKGLKPKDKDYSLSDGASLYLVIKPTGYKSWRFNYSLKGKSRTLYIGEYPTIGLAKARELHQAARELLQRGIDPSQHKQQVKAFNPTAHSFEAIGREWFVFKAPTWEESYSSKIIAYLEQDVFPWLGAFSLDEVKPKQIIDIIQRIEARGAGESARRVKRIIGRIYQYAITLGIARSNPARDIETDIVLKPRLPRHLAAITEVNQVGELLRNIDVYQGTFIVRCALKLSALVMLRPKELRSAEWSELDFTTQTWTIPIKRMKALKMIKEANQSVHIVPLSRQAIEILQELKPLTGRFPYVFPSARGASRCMSEAAVRAALRSMGYGNDEMTAHGFRSMASTLLNQMKTKEGARRWDADAIERQLAHKEPNKVRAAYDRAEHLEERREMLQVWADYLDDLKAGGKVIPLRIPR